MSVFPLIIYITLNILKFSLQYYDMKFGHIYMNYYDTEDCIGNYTKQIVYSVEDEDVLYLLNSASTIVDHKYSFDFFSTTLYYSNSEGDDEEVQEDDTRRAILCNGLCYLRQEGADILVGSEIELAPDYGEESKKSKYYSCVFNNIIKNATITLEKFSDKHCKSKLEFDSGVFYGNQSCWEFGNYSYRPLYYEDDKKAIYYHLYNSNFCTSDHFEYFDYNGYFFECDKKCHKDKNNDTIFYKCQFNSAENKYIFKNFYSYLKFFIIIFIL